MDGRNIIVVGASAGGVEALIKLVEAIPENLPAAIFVTLHVPASGASVLPTILSRYGRLPASHPRNNEPILPGRIYVAPPDYHMLIKRDRLRLTKGPRENGHRPAIDPLFRTAARVYGAGVIGVILSGARDDGTAGLLEVKRCGGVTVAQHPGDASYPSMPLSAIEHVEVDHVLPVSEIGALFGALVKEGEVALPAAADDLDPAELEGAGLMEMDAHGQVSGYICPDCGGALWQMDDRELLRYRCRVGHAWSAEGLLDMQAEALERAMWMALHTLEERISLARQSFDRAQVHGRQISARLFERIIRDSERSAEVIRAVLAKSDPMTGEENPV